MDKQEGPGLLGELGTAEGFSAGSPRPGPQPGHLRSPSAFVGCVLWGSEQRPPPCPGQPQPLPSLTLSHLRSDLPVGSLGTNGLGAAALRQARQGPVNLVAAPRGPTKPDGSKTHMQRRSHLS